MTIKQFAHLVRDMREVQKRYFGGDRSSEVLRQALDLERRVDNAAKEVLDDRPSLFGGEAV